MRAKHLSIPTLLLVLSFLFSCKKDDSNNPSGSQDKVKTYIEDVTDGSFHEVDTFNISYDGSGRITNVASAQLSFIYKYSGSNVALDIYSGNAITIHEDFYLNSNGLVDSTFQHNDTNDSSTEKYFYNGNVLTQTITYSYTAQGGSLLFGKINYMYDNAGNLYSETEYDEFGSVLSVTTYNYTTTTIPKSFSLNPSYIAVQSQLLPATKSKLDPSGGETETITYTYVIDGSGRLSKETDTANDGSVVVKTYLY